ncbi:MAG: MBL fold metallo-hydrolase [Chloroflexi bacterium]|nr:MBL fold metallo-hydrolase [Chloroflexota bacterium]
MITLGDMRLHLINDCDILVEGGGAFGLVPRALWRDMMPPDEENRVPMTQHVLLVQVGGRNIVIDTGYGEKVPEKQRKYMFMDRSSGGVRGALARLDLTPDDIDLVIDTHLHGDHSGGNTCIAPDGRIVPMFPNAEYVVQAREYHDATHPNERTRATYLAENYVPLYESGQLRLLEGDTEFAPGIQGVVTPGHTPGHMSVILESRGQYAMFTCDLSSYAIHFERLGWMTGYDLEPVVTLETKRIYQKWALETNALLIFPHDPVRPMGRYVQGPEGKCAVVKVDEPYL